MPLLKCKRHLTLQYYIKFMIVRVFIIIYVMSHWEDPNLLLINIINITKVNI